MLLPVHPVTTLTATVPFSPFTPVATPHDGQVKLSWQAPDSDGGAPIQAYIVTPYLEGTLPLAPVSVRLPGHDRDDRRARERRHVHVHGRGAELGRRGLSVGADRAQGHRRADRTVGRPGLAPGDGAVRLTWIRPADTNGAGITGYVVTPFLSGVAQPSHTFASAATSATVTGLTNGLQYTFTVAATNGNGTGPQSDASSGVVVGTPLAPSDVVALSKSGGVTVSWQAPDRGRTAARVTGYVVTPFIGDRAQAAHDFNSHATHQTINGLRAGTIYSFKVSAKNVWGIGPRSLRSNRVKPR